MIFFFWLDHLYTCDFEEISMPFWLILEGWNTVQCEWPNKEINRSKRKMLFFWPKYFREVGRKYENIFVQMKTSKSHSEINWPLSSTDFLAALSRSSQVRSHSDTLGVIGIQFSGLGLYLEGSVISNGSNFASGLFGWYFLQYTNHRLNHSGDLWYSSCWSNCNLEG